MFSATVRLFNSGIQKRN